MHRTILVRQGPCQRVRQDFHNPFDLFTIVLLPLTQGLLDLWVEVEAWTGGAGGADDAETAYGSLRWAAGGWPSR